MSQVIHWAKGQRRIIQDNGVELSETGVRLARSMGIGVQPDSGHARRQGSSGGNPVIYSLAKITGMLSGKGYWA